MKRSASCPCQSEKSYANCCEPYHTGTVDPPTAEALMRSRYAAFALRNVDYIYRTLHPDHEDRARPKEEVISSIRMTVDTLKYMGLKILEVRDSEAEASSSEAKSYVRFAARVFNKGRNISFVELSEFARDESLPSRPWRYVGACDVDVSSR